MQPEEAARLVALDDATLTGLVGTRFYPMKLPQNPTLPAITYFRVAGTAHHDIPFAMPLVQFTCWGTTWAQARAVSGALYWALARYRGTKGGIKFEQIAHESDLDLYDSVTGYYAVPATYRLIHEEV